MLAMADSAVMLHDRRIEGVAVERIDGGIGLLLRLSMSGRGKSGKGNAQDCKTFHHSSPYFLSAHVGRLISSAWCCRSGEGTPQNVAVLLQHRFGASEFQRGWQGKLRKIRRVVSDAIRDVRRCADLQEVM
jgi:hypothetical protein